MISDACNKKTRCYEIWEHESDDGLVEIVKILKLYILGLSTSIFIIKGLKCSSVYLIIFRVEHLPNGILNK